MSENGGGGKQPSSKAIAGLSGAALAGLLALFWDYHRHAAKAPRIFVGEGALKKYILPRCKLLLQPYHPPLLASGRHAQTVLGLLRTATIRGLYNRQLIIATDGGTLALDWWRDCDRASFAGASATTPIFLVLHGINGGSHEGYCKWACAAAANKGWRAAVLNYRGCNGLPMTSPRGYAATMTHDVHTAVASVRARFPQAPLFAAGYSLGGVILTKYLAEADCGLHGDFPPMPSPSHPPPTSSSSGDSSSSSNVQRRHSGDEEGRAQEEEEEATPSLLSSWAGNSGLTAAAVVSSPICLTQSSENISKPWTLEYMYNLAIAYKLREYMTIHQAVAVGSGPMDIEAALEHWTVKAIEDEGLPAQFGYNSRAEYYEHASSLYYIPQIRTPTLLLLSEDDPFLGVLPDLECAGNPHTLLAATARGGHVAFIQGGMPLVGPTFMDEAVLQFFAANLEHAMTPSSSCSSNADPSSSYPSSSTLLPVRASSVRSSSSLAKEVTETAAATARAAAVAAAAGGDGGVPLRSRI